ncbi:MULTISPECIES: hypothetical protein [unclassified Luteimonas]
MKTKAEIDAALTRLSARMQALCSELPPGQVLEAFSREARPLTEQVAPEYEAYVEERVHAMLAEAGLIPDDAASG